MNKVEPFDIIKDLSVGKVGLITEDDQEQYNPYLTNQAFSYYLDSILLANEMNMSYHLSKFLQHQYYFYGLKKRKRYTKWNKKQHLYEEEIAKYFSFGLSKAKDAIKILTAIQIKEIVALVSDMEKNKA